uniref:Citrate transporter-like domain-containing protein n=1 Tax=Ananas comosus var. bracteatus TaxID=296719 RepID=A0A6V7QPF5_ANACO|nr:unnamed protein product [Ananas comosus var. bracteatus]
METRKQEYETSKTASPLASGAGFGTRSGPRLGRLCHILDARCFSCCSLPAHRKDSGSLLGAMLMVVFQVISPDQAYAAIDLPILGLLFGTMVVSIYLERANMFQHLGKLLSWKSKGGKDLLCRVCLVSALSSALFTNDTTCIVLTEFVLKLTRQHNLPVKPFLLALASSANIGSSATPIGNPQNLVIAIQSKIPFLKFFTGIAPAMLLGVAINIVILLCMFWNQLSAKKAAEEVMEEAVAEDEVRSHKFSPARMSHMSPLEGPAENHNVQKNSPKTDTKKSLPCSDMKNCLSKKQLFLKSFVYLVTVGMLVAFLLGLNMSWTAVTAALVLVVIDFKDAGPSLDKVSYSLLVFFCGMFITVDGFNKTGYRALSGTSWSRMRGSIMQASGSALPCHTTAVECCVQRAYCAASWRAGGEVGGGAVALGGGAGVADSGVGEHGGRELVAAGVGGEPNRVRAGAAVAGLRLHPLLLGPPRLRPPLHPHRHRRRPPPHPRLTNLPTCRSLEEECEIN